MKLKGYCIAIVSAVSYGLIPLFMLPLKKEGIPVDVTLFYRFFIAAALISSIMLIKKIPFAVSRAEMGVLMSLGVMYGLSSDLLFMGYDYLSPGVASTVLFMYPVFVALIMGIFFKERITSLTIIALLLSFVGVILLSVKPGKFELNTFGLLVVTGAAMMYGSYIVTVNKSVVKTMNPIQLTFYALLFCSIYYLLKVGYQQESLVLENARYYIDFTLFALVTTVLSTIALAYAIQLIGSTPTSILGALEPVVAVMISVLLFNEVLNNQLMGGILLIVFAVLLNMFGNQWLERRSALRKNIL